MCILLNSVCFSQRFFYLDKGILKYAKSQTDVSLLPGPACYCKSVQAARVSPGLQFSVGNGFSRWHRALSRHPGPCCLSSGSRQTPFTTRRRCRMASWVP